MDGLLNKKGIGSVPNPFGMDAYTASDKFPVPNSGLAMWDYAVSSRKKPWVSATLTLSCTL